MKDLSEWLKSEEAQGYSEDELVRYLKKNKYKDSDINEAVWNLHGFNLMRLGYWSLVSIGAWILIGYAIGELYAFMLGVAGICVGAGLLHLTEKRRHTYLSLIVFLLTSFFVMLVMSDIFFFEGYIVYLSLLALLLGSYVIFLFVKKNYYLVFHSLLVSFSIAFAGMMLLYFAFVFLIVESLPVMSIVYLGLIVSPFVYLLPIVTYLIVEDILS